MVMKQRLTVTFDEPIFKKLKSFSDERGENASTAIRRSVRRELASHSYLSKEQKKALGVNSSE